MCHGFGKAELGLNWFGRGQFYTAPAASKNAIFFKRGQN